MNQLFIHPDQCIDCGACEPVCPVKAIFAEDETPEQWKHSIGLNRQFFAENPGVSPPRRTDPNARAEEGRQEERSRIERTKRRRKG